jgi:hypothetical protein
MVAQSDWDTVATWRNGVIRTLVQSRSGPSGESEEFAVNKEQPISFELSGDWFGPWVRTWFGRYFMFLDLSIMLWTVIEIGPDVYC